MPMLNFEVVEPSKSHGQRLVDTLEAQSKSFVRAKNANDQDEMRVASEKAWQTMVRLADLLRGEEDHQRVAKADMDAFTALIIKDLAKSDVDQMLANKHIDRLHSNIERASLRVTMNKIIHFDKKRGTYRVARSNAHYLVLSGNDMSSNKGPWLIEIHVATLCKMCRAAIK